MQYNSLQNKENYYDLLPFFMRVVEHRPCNIRGYKTRRLNSSELQVFWVVPRVSADKFGAVVGQLHNADQALVS